MGTAHAKAEEKCKKEGAAEKPVGTDHYFPLVSFCGGRGDGSEGVESGKGVMKGVAVSFVFLYHTT